MTQNHLRDGASSGRRRWTRIGALGAAALLLATAACGPIMTMLHGNVPRPPQSEFGLGPRTSQNGSYRATLAPAEPLKTRRMMTVQLLIEDASGNAVDGAAIAVDGGMPQHGHGLPTRPRVTQSNGSGSYDVEGVRFNMGGWWVMTFRIATPAGTDSVTFNLDL